MNALFELIGKSKYVTQQESETIADTPEYTVEFHTPNYGRWKHYVKVLFHYKPTSKVAREWINKVAFAKIQFGDDSFDESSYLAILRSIRTEQEELEFLEALDSMDYDNGYGSQHLFGTIVFKDGTWLERGEYDGSEWWEYRKLPTEESLFGNN